MSKKKDIENREDIEKLISAFYEKMLADSILGFIFTDIAKVNLDHHLPVICDFWENVLFNKPVYKRGSEVVDVHLDLNKKIWLKRGHFRRWLYLFCSTVDDLYDGATADRAKERAASIAQIIQKRLSLIPALDKK